MSASGAFLAVYIVGSDAWASTAQPSSASCWRRVHIGAVFQPLFGRLADRTDRVRLVLIGLIMAAIGQFFIPDISPAVAQLPIPGGSVRILPWLLALYVLIGTAEAILLPAQNAIFVTTGRRVDMGSIMGMSQMASSIGFLGGSLLGAAVVSAFGIASVFRFAALISVGGAALFLLLLRPVPQEARTDADAGIAAAPLPGATGQVMAARSWPPGHGRMAGPGGAPAARRAASPGAAPAQRRASLPRRHPYGRRAPRHT